MAVLDPDFLLIRDNNHLSDIPRHSDQIIMAHLCNEDILSLIFIDAFHSGSSPLLTLRSVNRTWFDVVGRTPQLWTRLVLNQKSDFIDLEYAKFYLLKSGAVPIDVRIMFPDYAEVNQIGGVTALLRNHAPRFRSLELHVRFHEELEALISSIGGGRPAPLLEALVLYVGHLKRYSDVSDYEIHSLPTAFTPSPRLTHIKLSGPSIPKTLQPTVTSLTIVGPHHMVAVNNMVSCVESTPSLRHLKFNGYDDPSSLSRISSKFENPRIVSLPDLLTANVSVPGYGVYLLRVIDAPKLYDIHLDGSTVYGCYWQGDGWDEDVSALFSITIRHLSAHSRNLRRMTLRFTVFYSPLEDYTLILSGAGFPQLEELELIGTDIDDKALLAASGGGGSSTLKKLTMRQCNRVTGTGLLGFSRGRRNDFRLSLFSCRGVRETAIVELSEIVNVFCI